MAMNMTLMLSLIYIYMLLLMYKLNQRLVPEIYGRTSSATMPSAAVSLDLFSGCMIENRSSTPWLLHIHLQLNNYILLLIIIMLLSELYVLCELSFMLHLAGSISGNCSSLGCCTASVIKFNNNNNNNSEREKTATMISFDDMF